MAPQKMAQKGGSLGIKLQGALQEHPGLIRITSNNIALRITLPHNNLLLLCQFFKLLADFRGKLAVPTCEDRIGQCLPNFA